MEDDHPGLDLFPTENPYEFPSDETLAELSSADQIEALNQWFQWNFEDPAEMTPYESREGGYIYIWGGPYEAREELYGRFDGLVPEHVIEAAAEEVESNGLYDWAPTSRRIRQEDEVEFDNEAYGNGDEVRVRERVRQSLYKLEKAVDRLEPARNLIGHNNPPEPLIDIPYTVPDKEAVREIIGSVREQLESESLPRVESLISDRRVLTELYEKIGAWISQKANLAVDEAAKSFGKTTGNLAAAGVAAALGTAFYNLWSSLQVAANAIGEWINLIQLPF